MLDDDPIEADTADALEELALIEQIFKEERGDDLVLLLSRDIEFDQTLWPGCTYCGIAHAQSRYLDCLLDSD